jgi:hypothetical protein
MPSLRVTVDGTPVATIATEGREVISLHVGGNRVDDGYADLSFSGGVYSVEGETYHRVWIDQMPLKAGQIVEVAFLEHGTDSGPGRTVEEIYPGHTRTDPPTTAESAELFAELRRAPMLRSGFTVSFSSSTAASGPVSTHPDEHGFGFSVLWNNLRPDTASASLHCFTIDYIQSQAPGRHIARERIAIGSTVRLDLIA